MLGFGFCIPYLALQTSLRAQRIGVQVASCGVLKSTLCSLSAS